MVQPMLEFPQDVPEGWGVWDDEIEDRRVTYMVGQINGGHKYKKNCWHGGDSKEVLYDHEKMREARKRKRVAGCAKTEGVGGPVLKQKRVSGYFRRSCSAENDKDEDLALRVSALEKTVAWLKKRLARRKRIVLTPRKVMLGSTKTLKKKKKNEAVETKDDEEPDDDQRAPGESENDLMEEEGGKNVGVEDDVADAHSNEESYGDEHVQDVDGNKTGDKSPCGDEAAYNNSGDTSDEVEVEDSSSEEPPPVLAPVKEGDGVPLQWVEKGVTSLGGALLYRATTSNTHYVSEDPVTLLISSVSLAFNSIKILTSELCGETNYVVKPFAL